MSAKTRSEIAYWFMLIIGVFLMTIQLKKYYENSLEFTTGEMIINIVSISLMIFPKFILNMANKIITNKKQNENNED